jgi:tRNA(Arg) A34 adenosine deaminase TadA
MKIIPKKEFMKEAIRQAELSAKKGEYAIGAVVKNGKVIAKGDNRGFRDKDASAHAEVVAMRKASKKLKNKYLRDCILYTTNEPCCMCAGMALWAQIGGIVYGANIKDMEKDRLSWSKKQDLIDCKTILKGYGRKIPVVGNFMRKECKALFAISPK